MTGSAIKIGIDGYNIALARGTGVASYGRALANALKNAGYHVDLIFGVPVSRKAPNRVKEAQLIERLANPALSVGRRRWSWRTLDRDLGIPLRRKVTEIVISGEMVTTGLPNRLPPFDRVFSYSKLFPTAAVRFKYLHKFLEISMPDPPDIMHWTYPVPVRLAGCRNIYTIHDVVPLKAPTTTLDDKSYYNALLEQCISHGDKICTVSETSRADIMRMFGCGPEHIVNTYQSVDLDTAPDLTGQVEERRRIQNLFGVKPGEYFLFFGAIEPKKNVGRLIEAALVANTNTPLLIVGGKAWKSDEETRILDGANGITPDINRVRHLGYQSREDLLALIRNAKAVTFPSLYEGFGLPALEAMAMGVPLLTSNQGSLPEIVGDAALTVDPYDIPAMSAAIERLDRDADLRAHLSRAGKGRSGDFSEQKYVDRLDNLYRSMLIA